VAFLSVDARLRGKVWIGAALGALVLAPSGAFAADIALKSPIYTKAAPIATWTGFYAGIDYGSVIGQARATDTTQTGTVDINDRALTIGLHAGYDWQVAPHWLIGVVGDFGYLGVDKKFVQFNDLITVGVETDWYATARARAGYIVGPSVLYATGGLAFVHQTNTFGGDITVPTAPGSLTQTRVGWTIGGGIETRLSQHWTASAEYLYIDAGSDSFATTARGLAASAPSVATFSNQYHLIKSKLSYRFGPGAYEGLPIPFISNFAPLSPAHAWGGLYAGVNVGGALSLSEYRLQIPGFGPAGSRNGINDNGLTGGVQVGYNWMLTPQWLVGAEADFNYVGASRTIIDWFDAAATHKMSWLGTVRARLGRSTGPALFYVTAGAAFADVTRSYGGIAASDIESGWTAGSGTEIALSDHWAAKLEYLYVDLGKDSSIGVVPVRFDHRYQLVRAGLNYSFNAPVVARY